MKQKAPREFKLENCLKLLWVRLDTLRFPYYRSNSPSFAILRGEDFYPLHRELPDELYFRALALFSVYRHSDHGRSGRRARILVYNAYEQGELKNLINMPARGIFTRKTLSTLSHARRRLIVTFARSRVCYRRCIIYSKFSPHDFPRVYLSRA